MIKIVKKKWKDIKEYLELSEAGCKNSICFCVGIMSLDM